MCATATGNSWFERPLFQFSSSSSATAASGGHGWFTAGHAALFLFAVLVGLALYKRI